MLYSKYLELQARSDLESDSLFGLRVENQSRIWLALDAQDFVSLLLPARRGDARPDIRLRAIDAVFSRDCEINSTDDTPHEDCFSMITLKNHDPAVVRLFLRVMEERFIASQPTKNNNEVAARLLEVATLFGRVSDRTTDIVGLWGELYLISLLNDVGGAVEQWAKSKTAKFDFIADQNIIEVKTTLSAKPIHHFTLEQLCSGAGYNIHICSLCLAEVPGGQTVGDLVDKIAEKISDQKLRQTFFDQCLSKGGEDLYRNRLKLQTYPRSGFIAVYHASEIPTPIVNERDPISLVKFSVDLSSITPKSTSIKQIEALLLSP